MVPGASDWLWESKQRGWWERPEWVSEVSRLSEHLSQSTLRFPYVHRTQQTCLGATEWQSLSSSGFLAFSQVCIVTFTAQELYPGTRNLDFPPQDPGSELSSGVVLLSPQKVPTRGSTGGLFWAGTGLLHQEKILIGQVLTVCVSLVAFMSKIEFSGHTGTSPNCLPQDIRQWAANDVCLAR